MPSRWLSLWIILVWFAVNGWLFWHDLLPRLLPGQPPPYYVELTADAQTNRPYINWSLSLDDKPVGQVKTRVEHLAGTDYYDLVAKIKPDRFGGEIRYGRLHVAKMESVYRVNETGDLLGLSAQVDATIVGFPSRFTFQGEVAGRRLTPRVQMDLFGGKTFVDLETADTPRGGAVLMPLHPVNRVEGIQRGQAWNVYLLDYLSVCAGSEGGMSMAHARVRPEEVLHERGRHRPESCLVIDYEADDVKVTTRVASRNGLVMSQESTRGSTRWTINRE